MDLQQLKQFKLGDQISLGKILPGLEKDEEALWTATNVLDATREEKGIKSTFRWVEFKLEYLGVFVAEIRATEQPNGSVNWENQR